MLNRFASDMGDISTQYDRKMQARSRANKFASSASIPVMFMYSLPGPMPTYVDVGSQAVIKMIMGGLYTRNALFIFAILGTIECFRKKYPGTSLLITFTLIYLLVLAYSGYSVAHRFHFIILPYIYIITSIGIYKSTNKQKNYWLAYIILLSFIILLWNYSKLAGRGLI